MNFSSIFAIFVRQLYLVRGSPTRFINIFSWILIDVLVWGFTTRYLAQVGGSGFNFAFVFLGAVLLWEFLSQVQRGFILASLEDVYTHNYLNLFASPLRVSEYICGLVLSAIATSSIAFLAVFFLSSVLFGFSIFSYGLLLVPALCILLVFGVTLGIIAAAVVMRLGPSGEWLAWPLPAIISPFAGVFYPLAVLPGWMQHVAQFLPPSSVFEAARTFVTTGEYDASTMALGVLLSLLYLMLACGIFVYVYRYAIRNGLIARFSAESA